MYNYTCIVIIMQTALMSAGIYLHGKLKTSTGLLYNLTIYSQPTKREIPPQLAAVGVSMQ